MINIRKILLLSALLISASSIIVPMYAMKNDNGDVDLGPRVIHPKLPHQLTPDMIPEIRKHRSFLTTEGEYVLQNPGELSMFKNCLSHAHPSFDYTQYFSIDRSELNYVIVGCLNANYENRQGIFWEFSRLTFKKQDPAPAKPLAVTEEEGEGFVAANSTQASSSVDSSNNVSIRSTEGVVEEPVVASRLRPEEEVEELVVANGMQAPMYVDSSHEEL